MASTARLDELKKKFEENPRRYFAPLANEHRKSGDLDQAISICRAHLPQQPAHISGHIVLAQALFEAGSLDESRDVFQAALGLDPENLIALRYLGDIARDSADLDTARSWYQRVLDVDPRNDEIVQIVRELDARSATPAPAPEPEPVAEPARPTPPPADAPSAQMREADESRFAPLSIEQIDIDEPAASAAPEAMPDESAGLAESFDVHAAWDTSSPTVELEMLDTHDADAFDMSPAASAASLFDVHAHPANDDALLDELSNVSADATTPDREDSAPDHVVPRAETSTEPSAEELDAIVAEMPAFEEGSFYLEPPPPEPASVPEPADISQAVDMEVEGSAAEPSVSENVEMELIAPTEDEAREAATTDAEPIEVAEAVAPLPDSVGFEAATEEPAHEVDTRFDAPLEAGAEAHPEERAEPIAALPEAFDSVAEMPELEAEPEPLDEPAPIEEPVALAEPEMPSTTWQSPADELGLEVMEFVPPTRESAPAAPPAAEPTADPLLGRTLELSAANTATPPAFVTETMAELYLQQGFRAEALAVYRELLQRNPSDENLRDRVAQIESGSASSIGMAAVSENVVDAALRRQSAGRSVRSFFASLAARRAPHVVHDAANDPHGAAPEAGGDDADVAAVHGSPEARPQPSPDEQHSAPTGAIENPYLATAEPPPPIAPMMSAAEALAEFDPFADAMDTPDEPATTEDFLPPEPFAGFARTEDVVAPVSLPNEAEPKPAPVAEAQPTPAAPPLEALFPDTPVTSRSDAVAETLATAFGGPEPQGRPTRAANNELSLDRVFRGAPAEQPAASDGAFSFDQFFSDAQPAREGATGSQAAPAAAHGGTATDTHDIEQFTAWLEGLKKK